MCIFHDYFCYKLSFLIWRGNLTAFNHLLGEVYVNFNILSFVMLNRIVSNVDGSLIMRLELYCFHLSNL